MPRMTVNYSGAYEPINHSLGFFGSLDTDYVSPADIEDNPLTGKSITFTVDDVVHKVTARYFGSFYGDDISDFLPAGNSVHAISLNQPYGFRLPLTAPDFPDVNDYLQDSYASSEAANADVERYYEAGDEWYEELDGMDLTTAQFGGLGGILGTFTSSQPITGNMFTSSVDWLASWEFHITGSRFADRIEGGNENDTLNGGAGDDQLFGHGNDDLLSGGGGNDFLHGGPGDDALFGGGGNDVLRGGPGDDVLDGGPGGDALNGGSGDDVLVGGRGGDVLNGGRGNDTASYNGAAARVVADLGNSANNKGEAAGDSYRSIENLEGSRFNDQLAGDGAANELIGRAGNDRLVGRAGNDTLLGGGGDDVLRGGPGNDRLVGGAGNDRLVGGAGNDSLNGGGGGDVLRGGGGDDVLNGGGGGDVLNGGGGNDVLTGGAGSDVLKGGSGADLLRGGGGSDQLFGGGGDDVLIGGGGPDLLNGGGGDDTLIGGRGGDRFVFAPGHGTAVVKDFEDNIDTLDLGAFGFASVQEAKSFGSNVGANAVFEFAGGEQLTLENMSLAQLTAADILV